MNMFALFFNFLEWLATFLFARATDFAVLTQEELRRLRNALAMAVCFPIVLVALGATAGAWSASAKGWIILLGAPVLLAQLFVLAWRRAIVGAALGAVFEWGYRQTTGLRAIVFRGLTDYINVLMWLVYTEAAVALVAVVLPVHEMPIAALVMFLALIGLAAHAVQTGREFTWPKRARTLLLMAFWAAVVVIVLPPLGAVPGSLRTVVNRSLTWVGTGVGAWLSGTGPGKAGAWLGQLVVGIANRAADNPLALLWAAGLALVAIVALVLVIRGRWWHALVLGLFLLLAVPAVSWIAGKAGAGELGLPAAGGKISMPPGVTKAGPFYFRRGRWVNLAGVIPPRTHCWGLAGEYLGATIRFSDGGPDATVGPTDDYGGRMPLAIQREKDGEFAVWLAEKGTGDCGRRR